MFEVGLASVCEEINAAFKRSDYQRVENLLWPALDQFNDMPQLWFYAGNVFFQTGRPALAAIAFEHCLKLDENPLVRSNLGASYRRLNQHDNGLAALKRCLELHPEYEPALVNYGAMWVNEGNPHEGIPYLEKAVKLGRERGRCETGAEWNLALLYLEAGRFADGFDLYRNGYGAERLVRTYGYDDVPEPKRLEPDDHRLVLAKAPAERPTLIVWGEQGLGDELMFATCLNDASYRYNIVFECHPRLERMHRNSRWFQAAKNREGEKHLIFPTRKDSAIAWPREYQIKGDYKCAIADLAAFYRRDAQAFTDAWRDFAPFYHFNQTETQGYRQQLKQMAGAKPVVGLATHGGVMTTARQYRTLRMPEITYLLDNTDCLFVSLDYDDMSDLTFHLHEKYPGRFVWNPAIVQHWDYDHTAALLAATDMNVLVCQSAAHVSAGIGANTRVLAPKRAAWREILVPNIGADSWYWWPGSNIKLYMQTQADSWKEPLDRIIADVKALPV